MSPLAFLQRPATLARGDQPHAGHHQRRTQLRLRPVRRPASRRGARPTLDLSSWKVAFNGAEPVRSRTLRALLARRSGPRVPARGVLPLLRPRRGDADGGRRPSHRAAAGQAARR